MLFISQEDGPPSESAYFKRVRKVFSPFISSMHGDPVLLHLLSLSLSLSATLPCSNRNINPTSFFHPSPFHYIDFICGLPIIFDTYKGISTLKKVPGAGMHVQFNLCVYV